MIRSRYVGTWVLAAILGAVPAFASAETEAAASSTDPEAPASNSMDATGTFSVNPTLQSDPGMNDAAKVGPSRTDMNAESDTQ